MLKMIHVSQFKEPISTNMKLRIRFRHLATIVSFKSETNQTILTSPET